LAEPAARKPRKVIPMKARSLIVILVSLCLGVSANAYAKKGGGSHSSSHSTSHSTDSHATSGSSLSGSTSKNTGSRGDSSGNDGVTDDNSPSGNINTSATRQQVAEEKRKAMADAKLARSVEQAAAEAQRKQQAEQAAEKAAAAAKAREAAMTDQQREAEALAKQQREAAWIARCNIQPVMTDEAIATCREVMTRPAPKVVPYKEIY
jgi:hypothetical protein